MKHKFDIRCLFLEFKASIFVYSLISKWSKSDPTQQAAEDLKALEKQKLAAQSDLQPLLSKDPGDTSSALALKLSTANNKHDRIAALADLYTKK